MKTRSLVAALTLAASASLPAQSPDLSVREVSIGPGGTFNAALPQTADTHYYRLIRSSDRTITEIALGPEGGGGIMMSDQAAGAVERAIYRIEAISQVAPLDSDADGIDDLFELRHPRVLDALDPTDADEDADGDGETNLEEYQAGSDPAGLRTTPASFVTSDGITISGQIRTPATRPGSVSPVLIMIHQGYRSRGEWDPYLPPLNAAGYITVAYDIRGHGESEGTFSNADFDNPNTSPKDLEAAIAFIADQPELDAERVGIIGSSVGGNLACVASQRRWAKSAINLSGKTSAVRNLAAEPNLDLLSMYHISSSGDGGGQRAIWANELFGLTAGARQVEVIDGSSAHGVAVIQADPTLMDRILDWFAATL
ncbi:MAG: alpha/beta hydrolase [Verrucomicrobiales bacterium]